MRDVVISSPTISTIRSIESLTFFRVASSIAASEEVDATFAVNLVEGGFANVALSSRCVIDFIAI